MEQTIQERMISGKRKFRLVLPLLALPFATLFFYALGGGSQKAGQPKNQSGFNPRFPRAHFREFKGWSKMNFYRLADLDSGSHQSGKAQNTGADATLEFRSGTPVQDYPAGKTPASQPGQSGEVMAGHPDREVQHIRNQLAALGELVQHNTDSQYSTRPVQTRNLEENNAPFPGNGKMAAPVADDPQLQQIDGMLNKILEIQHPGMVSDSLRNRWLSAQGAVLPVNPGNLSAGHAFNSGWSREQDNPVDSGIGSADHPGFYGLSATDITQGGRQLAIQAEIMQQDEVVSGSEIGLRNITPLYIAGQQIPPGQDLFGIAALENDRLLITVKSVLYQGSLFRVSLSVYDRDGLPGIYIPDAIGRKASKSSAAEAADEMNYMMTNPGLAAQAAGAGINAAKTFFDRKVRQVRVRIPSGYQIFLLNNQDK